VTEVGFKRIFLLPQVTEVGFKQVLSLPQQLGKLSNAFFFILR